MPRPTLLRRRLLYMDEVAFWWVEDSTMTSATLKRYLGGVLRLQYTVALEQVVCDDFLGGRGGRGPSFMPAQHSRVKTVTVVHCYSIQQDGDALEGVPITYGSRDYERYLWQLA
jgi:hypothetical protein